ncbi:MAG: hypothetical protein ACFCU5_13945 [Pleurocapsa sp.]
MNKGCFWLCNWGIWGIWGINSAMAQPTIHNQTNSSTEPKIKIQPATNQYRVTVTPLAEQLFAQPTAKHLRGGEVIINVNTRLYFLPNLVLERIDEDDTAVNFNTGFSWGITEKLQLALQFQHVDSSSPAKQGIATSFRTEDNEAALELKQQLWQNEAQTQALSGVLAASWGTRGFKFSGGVPTTEINNRDIFVALAVPFTANLGDRTQVNLVPTVAFFKEESAVFFHRLPDDDSSFGTMLGLGGGVSYQVNSQLLLWGDTFVPLTGNNSVNQGSGKPDKAIIYNAGLRYLINPSLGLDLYATNTFASFAPLSLTGDRELMGIGTQLIFMPGFIPGNRPISESFSETKAMDNTPSTIDGLAFFDGDVVASGNFILDVHGGSQGIQTALRYGLLQDLEAGIYLDYISGDGDESEQGIATKIRLLNQAENEPLTMSLAATVSLGNQVFSNFTTNNRQEFERRGFPKRIPLFTPGGDNGKQGKEFIATFSLPLQYQLDYQTAVWLTPMVGYAQRAGIELFGFNLGGSVAINRELSLVGEIGANFIGEGNAFIGNSRQNEIPLTLALRWTPLSLLKRQPSTTSNDPRLEFYLTNRVGFSTWHQLRVRDQNRTAIGIGLNLPF